MFVTNCISTTKIQKISEITNFFRHYFLSRTEVYNGLVVPPCDSISLASAICDLLEHPDKLSFMKDNIKNVWQVKMSWEQIADVNLSSYQSLL